jgi:uncharacterized protein YaaN involved in tellurite resistance
MPATRISERGTGSDWNPLGLAVHKNAQIAEWRYFINTLPRRISEVQRLLQENVQTVVAADLVCETHRLLFEGSQGSR